MNTLFEPPADSLAMILLAPEGKNGPPVFDSSRCARPCLPSPNNKRPPRCSDASASLSGYGVLGLTRGVALSRCDVSAPRPPMPRRPRLARHQKAYWMDRVVGVVAVGPRRPKRRPKGRTACAADHPETSKDVAGSGGEKRTGSDCLDTGLRLRLPHSWWLPEGLHRVT